MEKGMGKSPNGKRGSVLMSEHDELVKFASKWLRNKKKCSVVITEMTGGTRETADAVGWSGTACYLVEAKVSINDYKADLKKFFRRYPEYGIASSRYYLVPKELVKIIKYELPDNWGLLSFENGKIEEVIKAKKFDNDMVNKSGEIGVLLSVIKRIAQTSEPFEGANIQCYRYEGSKNPRAILGVQEDT
jgi:hypothetical protein